MKHSIRFFSLGLLVAAVLLFFYTLLFDNSESTATTEALIESVENEGYRVVPEEEYIAFTLHKDEEKQKETSSEKKAKQTDEEKDQKKTETAEKKSADKDKKEESEEKENKVKKATFTTSEGVVSQDIADILIDNDIIKKDERRKFLDYLDDNGYSQKVQLGKFTVTSDMGFKELAETITTYPGN